MTLNDRQHANLVAEYKALGAEKFEESFRDEVTAGRVKASEFDLGSLFRACYGGSEFLNCREGRSDVDTLTRRLQEAEGAVSSQAFSNITGQIVYASLLEKYQSEEFVFAKMMTEEKALILDGEKVAGITELGDISAERNEGDPYQEAGVGEDWLYSPRVPDYGRIVSVTWEAVFQDRTGQLLERAGDVGYWIGYGEEVKAIDAFIDENVTAHRYNWRNYGQIATYGDNSGTHTWDNLSASTTLTDWTSLNTAEQVFNGLTNPFTGTPIMIEPRHLVVTKQNEQIARRIVSATEIRVTTPGYATSGNPTQTNMANPYANKYAVVTSRLLAQRMGTDTTWYLADVGKTVYRKVAEPLNVVQAPANNPAEFERRVVARYRANKRYAHYVKQPRASVKCTV